jgi:hypothetical protein
MKLVRNFLALAILATWGSAAVFAYDISGDWPESKTQTAKETKRGAKRLFHHRKLASAAKNPDQSSTTADGSSTPATVAPPAN